MRRLFILAGLSIMAACLLVSCGGIKAYIDTDETVIAGVGQEFVIALDANLTTGYDWEESYDSSMISLEEEKYDPDQKEPGLVGVGGTKYFHFKALNKGETEIILVYKRSWEDEVAEEKRFTVNIR